MSLPVVIKSVELTVTNDVFVLVIVSETREAEVTYEGTFNEFITALFRGNR
jgi:hypothetical protein